MEVRTDHQILSFHVLMFLEANSLLFVSVRGMEGPNGCRPKSSEFQQVGLLEIVKLGPRALNSYLTSYGQNVQFWTFWTLLF
jgi:hypothetical protein